MNQQQKKRQSQRHVRGQVTIWIILGILILISLSIVVYIVTQQQDRRIEDTVVVPTEVQPFYDFTRNCLSTITKQGVVKIGLQGGYANVPFSISHTPDSFIAIDPAGIIRVPLWYYEGEERTPPLDFVNRELALYIQDNLPACLNNFDAFLDVDVIQRSDIVPQITIAEDDILVSLDWSVDLNFADGRTTNVPTILTRLPVKLKRIHELATLTMDAINTNNLFENMTIDLLALHPDIPMDGMEVDCTPTRWPIYEIRNDIEELLQYNIPQVRIQDTNSLAFNEDESVYEDLAAQREELLQALEAGAENPTYPDNTPEDAYYYFNMNFDVGAEHPDLKTGFEYRPDWGMFLDIEPRDGGMLRSSLVQGDRSFLSFVCINQYHFTYDLVYPVLMNIRDPEAFNGEGYNFQFAFPVLIDSNAPRRELRGKLQFNTQFADYDYCSKLGGDIIDLRAQGFESGLPFAIDLDDAEMLFTCGTQQCVLGTTGADEGTYRLRTALPQGCGNPWITAQKEGYMADRQVLVSSVDTDLSLDLVKLRNLSIDIIKHKYFKVDNRLEETGEPMRESESALIYVSVQNVSVPFEQYIEYNTVGTAGQNLPNTIQLAEEHKNYDITVYVSDAFGNIIAGYNANDLALSYDEITSGDTIEFHVLEPSAVPNTDQAQAETIGLIFGDQFSQELKPTIK